MHKIHDHETSSLDSKNNNQQLCEKRKSLIQLYGTVLSTGIPATNNFEFSNSNVD